MFARETTLRVGLMTFVGVGVAIALSLSVAEAAKPAPPPPPVTYAMKVGRDPGLVDKYYTLHGMNNNGDLLLVAWYTPEMGGYVRVWNTASDTWDENAGPWASGQDLSIVASPEFAAALDAAVTKRDDESPGTAPHRWSDVFWSSTRLSFADNQYHAINDSRQLTAWFCFYDANRAESTWRTFRFTPARLMVDGTMAPAEFIDLGATVEGKHDVGSAINNWGDVAGYAGMIGARPFLWRIDSSLMTAPHVRSGQTVPGESDLMFVEALPCAGVYGGAAANINDLGQVTGAADFPGSRRAFRYTPPLGTSPEVFEDLGALVAGGRSSGASINIFGHVAGSSYAKTTATWHAFLYTDRMVDLGTIGNPPNQMYSVARDINDNGQVVGISDYSSKETGPFLYTAATGMLKLWDLIDKTTLPPGTTAGSIGNRLYINDNYVKGFGQIGGRISVNGRDVPFILTPK